MATMLRRSSVSKAYNVAHELHEEEADHSLHNADATLQQRKTGAGRLLTAHGTDAFKSGGLKMEEMGSSTEDDALWEKHERGVTGIDYLQVVSERPTNVKTGKPLNQAEIAALERDKAAVRETIMRHATAGMRNLDKMNANLKDARAACGELVRSDRAEIKELERECNEVGHFRDKLSCRAARDGAERSAKATAVIDATAAMRALIARSKAAGQRIRVTGHRQERLFQEGELLAQRGWSPRKQQQPPRQQLPSLRTPSPAKIRGGGGGSPARGGRVSPGGGIKASKLRPAGVGSGSGKLRASGNLR